MPNNKKTAICFTGTCRALEFTHKNIKNNLIFSNPNCDLFFFITENKHSDKINKYFGNLDNANIIIDAEDEEDLSGLQFKPFWPNPPSTHQIFMRMLRSRKK